MSKSFDPKEELRLVKVQFCIEDKQVRTFDVPEDISKGDLWYTTVEQESIKKQSRADVREWRKLGYSTLLKNTFENAAEDAENFIYIFCSLEGHLYQRGLERQCCRIHGEERSDNKDRARYSVLETQSRLSKEKLAGDELACRISASYINASRDAKVFAYRIGKADEAVALGTEEVASVVDALHNPKLQRRLSNQSNCSVSSQPSTGSTKKFSRRMSNESQQSLQPSVASNRTLSRRLSAGLKSAFKGTPSKAKCPSSPIIVSEELYAAIA